MCAFQSTQPWLVKEDGYPPEFSSFKNVEYGIMSEQSPVEALCVGREPSVFDLHVSL